MASRAGRSVRARQAARHRYGLLDPAEAGAEIWLIADMRSFLLHVSGKLVFFLLEASISSIIEAQRINSGL